ncbi:serine hydrolase domain-containing protein [Alteromonas sediminis]|nr:serine hydrolase [Alteromonas sediminis]
MRLLTTIVSLSMIFSAFAGNHDSATQQLDEVLLGWNNPDAAIAGLVALKLSDGEVEYVYAKRHPDIAHDKGYTEHSKFRIASISKLVTAIGVMQLVEQGILGLDTDVSEYLGFALRNPHYPQQQITTRMLLSHTSGILDGQQYSIGPNHTIQSFFEPSGKYWDNGAHFADSTQQNGLPLGAYFHYSNLNFGVLGTLIERVSGQRFDLYMDEYLFKPLSIDAAFNVRLMSDEGFNEVHPLYRKQDNQWVAQVDNYHGVRPDNTIQTENPDTKSTADTEHFDLADYKIGTNGTFFSPQGGLRISIADLAKLAKVLINKGSYNGVQILKPETVSAMEKVNWRFNGHEGLQANGDTYYGLMQSYGLSVHHLIGRNTKQGGDMPFEGYNGGLKGHTGEAYGLLSGFFYHRETGDAYLYFITGTPELEHGIGRYSSFYRWEEAILTVLTNIKN